MHTFKKIITAGLVSLVFASTAAPVQARGRHHGGGDIGAQLFSAILGAVIDSQGGRGGHHGRHR